MLKPNFKEGGPKLSFDFTGHTLAAESYVVAIVADNWDALWNEERIAKMFYGVTSMGKMRVSGRTI